MAGDILDDLEREAKEYDKDVEINRILHACKLDAYAVIDLQPGVTENDIKRAYRYKSLLIHPDKTSNPLAPDAFDRLNKAHTTLMDEVQRARLDEATADARMLLLRDKGWDRDNPAIYTDDFKKEWRDKTRLVLIDNEIRKRRVLKVQMQEEGRQQQREEAEMMERKLKREFENAWESGRSERVAGWRDFQAKAKAKKSGAKDKEKTKTEEKGKKRKNPESADGAAIGTANGAAGVKADSSEPKKKKVKKVKEKVKILG